MAKGKNMLGKFRGKVGATVFRTEAGIGQIASEYNPNPKNPRTLLQTKQRSKMNLAGLVSKLTPFAAIAGLDSNRRMARSQFVSGLLKAVSVTGAGTSADPFKADIAPAEIVFSKGNVVPFNVATLTHADGGIRYTLETTVQPDVMPQALIIAMVNVGGKLTNILTKVETNNGGTIEGSMNVGEVAASDNVNVYAIPIIAENGAASFLADLDVDWANSEYSVSVARTLSTLNAYGESEFLGTTTYDA